MTSAKSATKRVNHRTLRSKETRERLFAAVPEEEVWNRHTTSGFNSVPRTLALACCLINTYGKKGDPAGWAYMGLWCRLPDYAVLTINNPRQLAAECGYSGERAVDTWLKKMRILRELGFIRSHSGDSGEFTYVFVTNPNLAIERLYAKKIIKDIEYQRFTELMDEMGAKTELKNLRELVRMENTKALKPRPRSRSRKL